MALKGRTELLRTINEILETDYAKIEHLKDGIAYCQLFDMAYPQSVQLANVNFNPKIEADYIKNYKILDAAFRYLKITKEIQYVKLASGNFHEHLEFLNWCLTQCQPKIQAAVASNEKLKPLEKRVLTQVSQVGVSSLSNTKVNSNLVPNRVFEPEINTESFINRSFSVDYREPEETIWSKKKIEMEELMVSLQNDLNLRLNSCLQQNIQLERADAERDFYMNKLVRIADLLSRSSDSPFKTSIDEILSKPSDIINDCT